MCSVVLSEMRLNTALLGLSKYIPLIVYQIYNLAVADINMGQKILLRLRPAWAPDTFYPEEDVVHTMLHEALHPFYLLDAHG